MTNILDKRMSVAGIVASLEDGMTIGIGGWGARQKPMAIIREIVKSNLKDLTIVSYGGCDVGMLASAGKIKKLVFSFVTLDAIPLEAHFRRARSAGEFDVMEIDEGMFQLGLKAAAQRLDFLPCVAGLGTDVMTYNPDIKTIKSPYSDEHYVAMPALKLDVALCHVTEADQRGNSWIGGPDMFFDEWFCRAAKKSYLSCERIVETSAFNDDYKILRMPIERSRVAGVAEAEFGAHPTSNGPDYGFDVAHLKAYNATAKEGWEDYVSEFVGADNYTEKVGGAEHIRSLPLPAF
ncbi:CoA transferase subunit A [Fretibacter rubidus]|uniref:CoA transferase subunit A n=1 Tax=Fretibacter rubidus TaxID=570162 RepID=UPI00352B0533